jgi:prepilin-type N-terminal cleavage/methylation domain-containing protein
MSNQKGFTLIELLVAVAIIAILASVIMTMSSNARNNAKDAAIRRQFAEFTKLLLQEYVDNGTYANLQLPATYFYTKEDCESGFTSSAYVSEARAICKEIVKNLNNGAFYVGANNPSSQKYSISTNLNTPVYLSGNPTGHDYCVGSSGTYDGTSVGNGSQTQKGCYNNP